MEDLIHTLSADLNQQRPKPEKTDKTPVGVLLWLREQGSKGGNARALALTPERRAEIAKLAGSAPKRPRRRHILDSVAEK